jgi:hypothetical protein
MPLADVLRDDFDRWKKAVSEDVFQVGYLLNFKPADPEFVGAGKAMEYARTLDSSRGVGIWTGQAQGSELVMILFEGTVYRK